MNGRLKINLRRDRTSLWRCSWVGALVVAAAALTAAKAVAGTVTAELSSTESAIGDTTLLTVVVQGDRDHDLQPPQVEGLVISQQSVSESTEFQGGHRVSSLQVGYVIYPQRAGTFTIPSFILKLDGKDEASLPLTLRVHAGGQGGGAQANATGQAGQAGQGGAPAAGQAKQNDTGGAYLERECNKTSPYVGEQVICTVRIFHRGNLTGLQAVPIVPSPDFRRFHVEGMKQYQKLVNGQRYGVVELTEIVVPQAAGSEAIPPYTLNGQMIIRSRRNPLDKLLEEFRGGGFSFNMDFNEEKQVVLKSEATPLTVKPLPEAGKPAAFGGLVGQFQVTAELTRKQLPAGETLTITIVLSGDNVSDMIVEPPLALSTIGRVYADKPEYAEKSSPETGLHSTRVYKLALVPAKAGSYDLGNVEIPVFNPTLGTYVALSAALGPITVEPSKGAEKPLIVAQPLVPNGGNSKEEVKTLSKDLIGLHRDHASDTQQTITSADRFLFSLVGGVPMSMALLSIGFLQVRQRQNRDGNRHRRSQALVRLHATIHTAEAELNAGRIEQGLDRAYRAFKDYLGDKLALYGSAMTARETDAILAKMQADESLRTQAGSLIAKLEGVAFGGQHPTASEASQWCRALAELAAAVEKL